MPLTKAMLDIYVDVIGSPIPSAAGPQSAEHPRSPPAAVRSSCGVLVVRWLVVRCAPAVLVVALRIWIMTQLGLQLISPWRGFVP